MGQYRRGSIQAEHDRPRFCSKNRKSMPIRLDRHPVGTGPAGAKDLGSDVPSSLKTSSVRAVTPSLEQRAQRSYDVTHF